MIRARESKSHSFLTWAKMHSSTLLILAIAASGIGSGTPALIRIGGDLSLQQMLTLILLVIGSLLFVVTFRELTFVPRILGLSGFVLGAFGAFVIQQGTPANYLSWVSGALVLLIIGPVTFNSLGPKSVTDGSLTVWVLLLTIAFAPILWFLAWSPPADPRIFQMSVVLTALAYLLVRIHSPSRALWSSDEKFDMALDVVIVGTAGAIAGYQGARSAIASLVIGSLFVSLSSQTRRVYWVGVSIAGSLSAALAVASTSGYERWFGGDRGVSFVGVDLNTNGRTRLAQEVVTSRTEELWILGRGLGQSGRLSQPLGLDSPLNEYLRVWTDIGFLGILLLVAVMWAGMMFWKLNTTIPKISRLLALVGIGLALSVLAAFDNLLANSWSLAYLLMGFASITSQGAKHEHFG